jgi:hypothetical protein
MKKKTAVFLSGLCLLVGLALCLISSLIPFDKFSEFSVSEDLTALTGLIFIIASVVLLFYADIVKK